MHFELIMIHSIIGRKLGQVQGFLENGNRIPMTRIDVGSVVVSQIKTKDKDGYEAVQLGFGDNKKADKPTQGHAKKAGLTITPRFFMETKADKIEEVELGSSIKVEEILTPGDIIDVTGTSKGKGYAGVVKRHHFKGGPKTHGQSDRHRAPGSIGQSTTPGRVYKGKRMAGHMGVAQVTVKNLEVIELNDDILLVKGLVPGHISSIVTITRRGINKKHVGLYKEAVVEEVVVDELKVEEIGPSVEDQESQRKEVEAKVDAEEKVEKAIEQGIPVEEASVVESDSADESKTKAEADIASVESPVIASESEAVIESEEKKEDK